jgi:hypothetical protein
MPREKLSLDTLGELDGGRAKGIINAAIRAAVNDLDDRGDDAKERKVLITLSLKKKKGNIFLSATAKPTLPAYQTDDTVGEIKIGIDGAKVEFQPLAPENPDQEPLPNMGHTK